ncbi:MAG: GAF domain-containing protein [Candidatus Aminicenantes bacterium]|nr:GAF domain-containing protein [Candidatus Aminicenantes bacterium]
MPYLILQQKDTEPKVFEITKPLTILGRRPTNDVFLTDQKVSRDHAKIIALEDDNYELQDVGAKHPITVNGKVISRHSLRDGDRIRLGDSILIYNSKEPCATTLVEFLPVEEMSQESVEVASLDAKKTTIFTSDDLDLSSLQKDHQRLMLLYEIDRALNIHLEDPYQLLDEILKAGFRTLDAERGFIALVDENTGELSCELIRDTSGEEELEKLEVSRTIIHKVLKEGVSMLTANALKDREFKDVKSVQEYSIRSAVCAPLLFRGEVVGIVYLDNRASAGSFSQDDLVFLTALCHQAGIAIGNSRLYRQVVQENVRLGSALKDRFQILGDSKAMQRVYKTIKKVAPSDVTVLIQGETGTGKELVAQTVHSLSSRNSKPFVAVNCVAIPKELIESELFGHEKGAFTDAVTTRQGKFELAHKGTIFLDEIGDMSLETQARVLRVLEQKELQRVGGTKDIEVDVRVVAATNKDLGKAVEERRFREDLYYRLNVVLIKLPTLKERKEDIILLAEHFMAGRAKKISSRAKQLLLAYDWPGNVRELKNCIERAVVLGDGEVIQPEDLPFNIRQGGKLIPYPLESLEHLEEYHILRVLRYTNWNKSETAKILGITRQTLDNKIDKYGIKK